MVDGDGYIGVCIYICIFTLCIYIYIICKASRTRETTPISSVNCSSWNNRKFMRWKYHLPGWDSNLRPLNSLPSALTAELWECDTFNSWFSILALVIYRFCLWSLTYEMLPVCGQQHPSRVWAVALETTENLWSRNSTASVGNRTQDPWITCWLHTPSLHIKTWMATLI